MKERIEILQIDQPQCENVFGVAPCTATGEPCFNTLSTCKDIPNYAESEAPLRLYFTTECENPTILAGMFPTLQSVGRREAVVNIAGADPDKQPLGIRDTIRCTLIDHPYHDRYVDPYHRQRTYNPMSQGTFWAKWLARNDDYDGIACTYYIGSPGDALVSMTSLHYELVRIEGPDSSGRVTVECQDVLKRADDRTIPIRNRGVLSADIDDSVTSFAISVTDSADLDDYPVTGYIVIGNEKMSYTRIVTAFSVTRGVDGSTAANHKEGDVVQAAEVVSSSRVDAILYDWLTNIIGVPLDWINYGEWQTEAATWLPTYIYSFTIYKPVNANTMIGELLRDSSAYLIPDLAAKKLRFRAIRPSEHVKSVTDDDNILAGSFAIERKPELRMTQIWFNYAMRDTLGSMTDRSNFARLSVRLSDDYLTTSVQKTKEIFSRFLSASNFVEVTGTTGRIIERFQGIQAEYKFALEGDDAVDVGLGDVCVLRHRAIVDIYGAQTPTSVQIISRKEIERGGRVEFVAQSFAFYFTQRLIAPDSIGSWTSSSDDERAKYMYISDDDGNMSDGATAPTIPS